MSSTRRKADLAQALPPAVEASFQKFCTTAGGFERAARVLFVDNYELRQRLRQAEKRPPRDHEGRAPYRPDR
jgi:hypothetical protein